MTQKTVLDPFAVWKSVYDKTESKWNEVIHETMQKEAFSEWMGQVQNGYLQYQKVIQNTTEAYLKQVNMPTRDEISSVASLIINLEEKVEDLDQKIEEEILTNPAASEINKLKASIAKLDKKMDLILKAIQAGDEPTRPTTPVENK
ncbi:poly(R)-hydroxyalkanoic acid synthase subunit PhaE [Neobacillus sp. LXY-4]|uniref:poly(R)-hydroxyalkanoic acid synthase subunit PhaE n=1 Tax=Neobacillus sp. LXY-4 TaxID=3379826 RepID=UPI003EE0C0CC